MYYVDEVFSSLVTLLYYSCLHGLLLIRVIHDSTIHHYFTLVYHLNSILLLYGGIFEFIFTIAMSRVK